MIKYILLAALMVIVGACSSFSNFGNRSPQAEETYISEEDQKNENRFAALMNFPTAKEAAVHFKGKDNHGYLYRQMQVFFIAQGLLGQFDAELAKLHKQKQADVDSEPNQDKLEALKIKLAIVWERYEEERHELGYIYRRLREEAAKDGGANKEKATYILGTLQAYFDESWKGGADRWALLSLVQDFKEMDDAYRINNPNATTMSFMSYFTRKLDNATEIADAKRQSAQFHKNRKKTRLDRAYEKVLNEAVEKRFEDVKAERIKEGLNREPNTDVLFPSPGGNGHITGNMFKKGFWAITFDDGPHPVHTDGMIDAMSSGGYEGTFFWLTKQMKLYPAKVERAKSMGFKRGSHSYTHANLPTLSQADLNHEINDAWDGFKNIVGQGPTVFRCPYGACGGSNSKIRKMIADKKMMHVFWNVDSLDWQDKDPASIFNRVKQQMELNGKGIVLYHDIHPQSVKATQLMVDWMRTKWPTWKVLTMDRMIQEETADPNSPSKNFQSP
jgi:peptidoglycan/xylan/chitin deacetylase (PgdA/CDA1 family)